MFSHAEGRFNHIAIEIELGNVESVLWADNVQTRKRRVRVKGFLKVNSTQIIDAGCGSRRWQNQETQDCQKKPKAGAAVVDGALHHLPSLYQAGRKTNGYSDNVGNRVFSLNSHNVSNVSTVKW